MSPQARASSTDTSGDAKGRFVVSLPRDLRPYIETKSEKIADVVEESTGARPALSPAQVVESLIRADMKRTDEREQEAAKS